VRVKASKSGTTKKVTRANGNKTKEMEKESIIGKMRTPILDYGKPINVMDKALKSGTMVMCIPVCGRMTVDKDKALLLGRMGLVILELL
jgi:hypothetical protein